MARDRANLRTDLWGDSDWRKLSVGAQHLYLLLLSHPTLNYAGVADWRAGRLAAVTSGRTRSDVELDAKELTQAFFVHADELTEEVVIRSFLRHDGVIKHPRLHVSMANDYAGIASDSIRAYIAFELNKLHAESPDLALWSDHRVQTILKAEARDMKADTQSGTIEIPAPLANPLAKDSHSDPMRTATATATATEASLLDGGEAKKPETKLPKNWAPTASHIEAAKAKNLDVMDEAENFRLHAETHDRRCASWNGAFASWLKKSTARAQVTTAAPVPAGYAWANQ